MSTPPNVPPSRVIPPNARFDPNTGAPLHPTPPPPRQNVMLWILAGIGILFVCMMFAGLMILHALRGTNLSIGSNGKGVEIKVPGGMTIRAGETADTGLPVYPGASARGKAGGVEITSENGTQSGVSGANYTTADSMEKVDEWYRGRLDNDFTREGPGPTKLKVKGATVQIETGEIAYISQNGPAIMIVSLKHDFGDGTKIDLARMGRSEAQ
jgi:hypothetical protein